MKSIKIANVLVFIMLLFPFYTKAQQVTEQKATQENKQEEVNNNDILIRQLGEKATKIDELETKINNLNEQLTNKQNRINTEKEKFKKEEERLNNSIKKLNGEKQELERKLEYYKNRFKDLNKIIYKQCLYYTLEKPYNPKLIDDAKKCLDMMEMDIKSSHSTEFDTYRPFLDTYAQYNSEVKNFLKNQMEQLKAKGWNIRESAKNNAQNALKNLKYYEYYQKKDKYPWKSIVYLDEVIDDFFKLLKSSKINEKNLQELIDKLPETETKVATETKVIETEEKTKAETKAETKTVTETEEKAETKAESKTKHKK